MTRPTIRRAAYTEALESRLGYRLGALLRGGAESVPHDVSERLRVAREQAISRAQASRRVAEPARQLQVNDGAATLSGGPSPWWLRIATWLPLAVLVGGLVAIEEWTASEQVKAAADIDTVLLTDDLPPDAWTDPGFREFLRSPPR